MSGANRPLAWRLVWRDLVGSPNLAWIVVALAFGVATLAAVGTARQAVLETLERDAAALLGGDLAITAPSAPLTAEERAAVLPAGARTSDAATTTTLARAIDGGDQTTIALKAVDDAWPLYGAVLLDPPMPPNEALRDGGVVVGAGLLERLGLAIGDPLVIGAATLTIRAELVSEPDRNRGGFQIGPRVVVDQDSLAATGVIQEGSVARFTTRLAVPDAANRDALAAAILRDHPEARFRVQSASTAQPGLRDLVGRLATFLTLAALAALATGGLGIALATRSHLSGKLRTIATLRALGARPGWVTRLYAAQLGILGLLGISLGMVLGAALPYLLLLLPAGLLPFALAPEPSAAALASAAAIGALVLAVFAWLPLAAARRTSPADLFRGDADTGASPPTGRDRLVVVALAAALVVLVLVTTDAPWIALATIGAVGVATALLGILVAGLQRSAGSLARLAPPRLRLPLREIARPGGETTPTVMALALGLGLLTVVGQTGRVLDAEIGARLPERLFSTVFIDIQPDQRAPFVTAVDTATGAELVEIVPYMRARLVKIAGVTARDVAIGEDADWTVEGDRGLTWSTAPPAGERPVAGAWWPEDHTGPLQVAIPADIAAAYGVGIGDVLTFNVLGRMVDAEIAVLRPALDWGSGSLAFLFVFSPGFLEAAPHSHIATVDIAPDDRPALIAAVRAVGSNVTPIFVDETIAAFTGVLDKIRTAVAFVAGLTLASGIVVLAAGLNAVRARQRYASAILKALGARRGDLVRTFLTEHAATGTIAGFAGLVLGIAGSMVIAQWALGLPFVFSVAWTAGVLVLGLAITTGTGLLGLARVVAQPVQPLLRAG
ncbi:MAG: FtsX-like permease family protein [Pseudomonadota bacterium]